MADWTTIIDTGTVAGYLSLFVTAMTTEDGTRKSNQDAQRNDVTMPTNPAVVKEAADGNDEGLRHPPQNIFRRPPNDRTPSHTRSAPKSVVMSMEDEDLGEAPVEREAGIQILKAWQELERKAKKAAQQTPSEREGEEEELFTTLEDDDDAVVLSRMVKKKSTDEEEDSEEEVKEDEGDVLSNVYANGSQAGGPASPIREPPAKESKSNNPIVNGIGSRSPEFSQRSGKSLRKGGKSRRKLHRRAESVEQAMFGLLTAPEIPNNKQTHATADLTQVLSSQVHPLQDSPLQATEQLINSAQNRVKDAQAQAKKKKKQESGRGHTLLDDSDSDKEREDELTKIINENGDKVTVSGESGRQSQSVQPLNRIEEGDSAEEEDDSDDDDDTADKQQAEDEEAGKPKIKRKKRRGRHQSSKIIRSVASGAHQDWELFQQFLTPRTNTMWRYIKVMGGLVVLPSLLIAALLFYLQENPEQQDKRKDTLHQNTNPFLSWWFLFLGVRQILTLSLAVVTQSLLIDYLALGSRFSLKYLGPAATLLAVQARGWPCVISLWAMYDLVLLSGNRPLAHHWGYWQNVIDLFNENNHSGQIVQSDWNFRILTTALVVGMVVAIKRVILGLILARKTLCKCRADIVFGVPHCSLKRVRPSHPYKTELLPNG